jgi:hypothetical protein
LKNTQFSSNFDSLTYLGDENLFKERILVVSPESAGNFQRSLAEITCCKRYPDNDSAICSPGCLHFTRGEFGKDAKIAVPSITDTECSQFLDI